MDPKREIQRPAFISGREWDSFDDQVRQEWALLVRDAAWLCDQPQFRRFVFTILNDPRFCGTDASPIRETPELTYRAVGLQDAGRAIRLVLQTASPRMWMRTMHDAFNASTRTPPESGKE